MNRANSKKIGVPRFSGMGRQQPKPGTPKWYKQHMPERFNNTKITVRATMGCDDETAETIAARVLRWNEGPQQHINDSLMKEDEKLFQKELLKHSYFTAQDDLEPPRGF